MWAPCSVCEVDAKGEKREYCKEHSGGQFEVSHDAHKDLLLKGSASDSENEPAGITFGSGAGGDATQNMSSASVSGQKERMKFHFNNFGTVTVRPGSNSRNHVPIDFTIGTKGALASKNDSSVRRDTSWEAFYEQRVREEEEADEEETVLEESVNRDRGKNSDGPLTKQEKLRAYKLEVTKAKNKAAFASTLMECWGPAAFKKYMQIWDDLTTKEKAGEKGRLHIARVINLVSRDHAVYGLGIGAGRFSNLKNGNLPKVAAPHNGMEVKPQDKENLTAFFNSLIWEQGYPCMGRRIMSYLTEFEGQRVTQELPWIAIYHRGYVPFTNERGVRVLAHSTFEKYRTAMFPNYDLKRRQEDLCNTCAPLFQILDQSGASDEEIEVAKRALDEHTKNALDLRRSMRGYIQAALQGVDLNCASFKRAMLHFDVPRNSYDHDNKLIETIEEYDSMGFNVDMPLQTPTPRLDTDQFDSERVEVLKKKHTFFVGRSSVVIEDYGQTTALPSLQFQRPGKNFYSSDMGVYRFFESDMVKGIDYCTMYDSRLMARDLNGVGTLRINRMFEMHQLYKKHSLLDYWPKVKVVILDNCTGQNKSQGIMALFSIMAVVFNIEIRCLFLASGHSHNAADRAVAKVNRAIKGKDIFTPVQIINEVQKMYPHSVVATWLNHADPIIQAYDIEALVDRHTRPLSTGFTRNHFFKFHPNATVDMMHMPNSSDYTVTHRFFDPEVSKAAIMNALFGCTELSQAVRISLVTLPRNVIKASIVKSLAENMYRTIPEKHLRSYYPTYDKEIERIAEREEDLPAEGEFVRSGGVTASKKRKAPTDEETREGLMLTVQNMGLDTGLDLNNVSTRALEVIASASSVSNAPKKQKAARGEYVPQVKGQTSLLLYVRRNEETN